MDFLIIAAALIVGFIIFFSVGIVPVVLKSRKEAKEEQEYQEFKKKQNNKWTEADMRCAYPLVIFYVCTGVCVAHKFGFVGVIYSQLNLCV